MKPKKNSILCLSPAETSLPSNTTSNSTSSSKTTHKSSVSSLPSFKSEASPAVSVKSFSLIELKSATKNFGSNSYLGEGGFGCVYKGWIDENTLAPTRPGAGIVVAIKKLKRESFQGHKEWLVYLLSFFSFLFFSLIGELRTLLYPFNCTHRPKLPIWASFAMKIS